MNANFNIGQPTNIHQDRPIDIKLTTAVVCEKCKAESFIPAIMIRGVSAIVSGAGKDGFKLIDTFACIACGNINESFKPLELRTPKLS